MEKEKQKDRKRGLKLGIAFAFIVVICVGVILAITLTPVNSTALMGYFADHSETIQNIKEFGYTKDYISKKSEVIKSKNSDYCFECLSLENYINSAVSAFDYYGVRLDTTIDGRISKKQAKEIDSLLNNVETNLKKCGAFLKEHEREMNSPDITVTAWESVRGYYKQILLDYSSAFDVLEDIINQSELKGVYANPYLHLSVKAMKEYYASAEVLFFGESRNSERAYNIYYDLKNFEEATFENDLIGNFYLNTTLKNNINNIDKIEEKTEGKVTFKRLIIEGFDYSGYTLSDSQEKATETTVNFLKGGEVK